MTDPQTPAAAAGSGGESPLTVDGYDAAFWCASYRLLSEVIERNFADFVQDGDEAEEALYVAALDRAAAALRAQSDSPDTARLDWLEAEARRGRSYTTSWYSRQRSGIEEPFYDIPAGYYVDEEGDPMSTLREAIDEARASSPSPRTPAIAAVEVPETALPTMDDVCLLIAHYVTRATSEDRANLIAAIQQLHSRASASREVSEIGTGLRCVRCDKPFETEGLEAVRYYLSTPPTWATSQRIGPIHRACREYAFSERLVASGGTTLGSGQRAPNGGENG